MSETRDRITKLNLIGGALCLDFANTVGWRGGPDADETLLDYEDLVGWARRAGVLSERQGREGLKRAAAEAARARAAHRKAIALREALHRVFSSLAAGRAAEPADLATINAAVADAYRHLRLAPSGVDFAWEWYEVDGALDLPIWIVARSAADLLVSADLTRVRQCAGERCDGLFLDASRNRSRRWCDMAECGNRAKARRNYARRRDAATGDAATRVEKGRKA